MQSRRVATRCGRRLRATRASARSYRGKTPDATEEKEILRPANRILVQTRHTDAIKARAACATVGESPEPSPSRQPCLEGLGPHCARGSAATDRPRVRRGRLHHGIENKVRHEFACYMGRLPFQMGREGL